MAQLLIIGGSGFVSGTLAQAALRAGHQVWVVTRGQRPTTKGVTSLQADRHDLAAFEKAIRDAGTEWDIVVDCIGYEVADAQQDITVFRKRARQFVFVSTDFVYDPAKRRFPQTDEGASYLADGYGGKKRLCELEFLNGDTDSMEWTILRPSHIYGPGSLLGCMPLHGRDPELLKKLKAGEVLKLVGGGHFLQQPVFAPDLAEAILSCFENSKAHRGVYHAAGPDIIESRRFYEIIADILAVEAKIEEVPVKPYWDANPDKRSFLCHRFYDLGSLRRDGLAVPFTSIEQGLLQHVNHLLRAKK